MSESDAAVAARLTRMWALEVAGRVAGEDLPALTRRVGQQVAGRLQAGADRNEVAELVGLAGAWSVSVLPTTVDAEPPGGGW